MSAVGCATCAVVVNWNGWRDTLVCLDSLLALEGTPLRVVLCDNGSTDGSAEQIRDFLHERLSSWRAAEGEPGFAHPDPRAGVLAVHLLRLPRNLGYAGALNAGIAWARERWSPHAYWLLNNDVEAQPGALDALVAAHGSVPDAGICGSVLLDWDEPGRVRAVAGKYCRWLGVGWHDSELRPGLGNVRLELDYPLGASMYVTAAYLDRVGLIDPAYFLFCEEMDWSERGRRRGLRPLVALDSRLRHKEGASTGSRHGAQGSRGGARSKSLLAERYGVLSRLRITRKLWPRYLPLVWCSLLVVVFERLLHGEVARAWLVLRLMFAPAQWLRASGPAQPRS